jgi:DNA-binding NarL/FixJ family response regulator
LSGAYICDSCRKPKPVGNDYAGKPLTAREKQVVALVRQAKANKEIAWQLHLSCQSRNKTTAILPAL